MNNVKIYKFINSFRETIFVLQKNGYDECWSKSLDKITLKRVVSTRSGYSEIDTTELTPNCFRRYLDLLDENPLDKTEKIIRKIKQLDAKWERKQKEKKATLSLTSPVQGVVQETTLHSILMDIPIVSGVADSSEISYPWMIMANIDSYTITTTNHLL